MKLSKFGYVQLKSFDRQKSHVTYETLKKTFFSKLFPVTFFAPQVQKDKTHHRKIQKISDLGVYLALLSEFFPGYLKFRLPSAALICTDDIRSFRSSG